LNAIQEIFDKYHDDMYEYTAEPATEEQLNAFLKNCRSRNIPDNITEELLAYYRQNNNFFKYFTCDDPIIFEWFDTGNDCLWLGQRDLWTFRCLVSKHKYAIGGAGDDSFGDDYEFDTIVEMLEAFLSGEKV